MAQVVDSRKKLVDVGPVGSTKHNKVTKFHVRIHWQSRVILLHNMAVSAILTYSVSLD